MRSLLGVVVIAALALSSTAKAGLIGTGPGSYCDTDPTQNFSRFGDFSFYASLSNGGFEGSGGWVMSGGARTVSGNEPFFISGNRSDSHSMLLPAGSSAYSGTVCFAPGDWNLRFLMRNVGSSSGGLHIQVIVPSLSGGLLSVLDGGTVKGSGTWAPSPRVHLLLSNVTGLIGTRAVAFKFTPVGLVAAYQIDDVYLDPWKGT
jgi:hypothetical protein